MYIYNVYIYTYKCKNCMYICMYICTYIMLCYVMLCYVMLCYVMLCYVMLCYVMLCYVMLCYVILCYVMLCYVMLCYVMLCYVMLCYVKLCYAMLFLRVYTRACSCVLYTLRERPYNSVCMPFLIQSFHLSGYEVACEPLVCTNL